MRGDYEIEWKLDTRSFLEYYKGFLSLCGWDPSLECVYDFGNGDIETWEGVKIGE